MTVMPTQKKTEPVQFSDGNVGVETIPSISAASNIRVWLTDRHHRVHKLYVTTDEATRLCDLLSDLLDELEA